MDPDDTKTNEGRAIPLNNELTEVFKSIIKCLHHDYVFTRNNKPIRDMRKAFAKACAKAEEDDTPTEIPSPLDVPLHGFTTIGLF